MFGLGKKKIDKAAWAEAETFGTGIGGSTIRIDHGIADAASPDYYG